MFLLRTCEASPPTMASNDLTATFSMSIFPAAKVAPSPLLMMGQVMDPGTPGRRALCSFILNLSEGGFEALGFAETRMKHIVQRLPSSLS